MIWENHEFPNARCRDGGGRGGAPAEQRMIFVFARRPGMVPPGRGREGSRRTEGKFIRSGFRAGVARRRVPPRWGPLKKPCSEVGRTHGFALRFVPQRFVVRHYMSDISCDPYWEGEKAGPHDMRPLHRHPNEACSRDNPEEGLSEPSVVVLSQTKASDRHGGLSLQNPAGTASPYQRNEPRSATPWTGSSFSRSRTSPSTLMLRRSPILKRPPRR